MGGNMGNMGGNMGNMGNNSMGSGFGNNMNGFGSTNAANMDALSQAYSGIQQYAGLSGLVNQGKGSFYDFFLSSLLFSPVTSPSYCPSFTHTVCCLSALCGSVLCPPRVWVAVLLRKL